ncbi:hypothetical protein AVEN_186338-1 [Araneus ventricosus]|uniref:Uncharacterized protein n=1 Tax=Araneus ventricosus TaxID=182803 RepID=A0A4Y2C4L0_ARAVE|nr:hypothetical protein AVEN_186338-1 [Araneus ventricosus]
MCSTSRYTMTVALTNFGEHMKMFLLIFSPILQVHFVGFLAVSASTCVGVPSSVAVFGLPDLLALVTESALLNFLMSFAALSWLNGTVAAMASGTVKWG